MKVLWIAGNLDPWLFPWMPDVAAALTASGVQLELASCGIPFSLAEQLRRAGVQLQIAQPWHRWPRLWQLRWKIARGWPPADLYHFWDPGACVRRAVAHATVGHADPFLPLVVDPPPSGDTIPADTGRFGQRTNLRIHRGVRTAPRIVPWPIAVRSAAQIGDPAVARRQLGLSPDSLLIGTIARLVSSSRLERLIWECDLVHHVRPEMQLVVLGDGPRHDVLYRFSRQSRSSRCTHFVQDPQRAWELLPHLNCLVLSSDQPSLANWLARAQTLGVPLLAPDTAWARQFIVPDVTGVLLPRTGRSERARAIWQLLTDPALCRRLAAGAHQHARRWPTAAQWAERLREIYSERLPAGQHQRRYIRAIR